ncbi:MAG: hypothetical protein AB1696_22895 [Planctomycetota bacterium]
MNEKRDKKPYVKPTIATEKVFEQAALACNQAPFDAVFTNQALKQHPNICDFASS